MKKKKGIARNWDVVKAELAFTWPRIRIAWRLAGKEYKEQTIGRSVWFKLHKRSNYLTEAYRATGVTFPRTLMYLTVIGANLSVLSIMTVVVYHALG